MKRALKPLHTTKGEPASKVGPTDSTQNEIKNHSEWAETNWATSFPQDQIQNKSCRNDVVPAIVSDLLVAPVMNEETGEMLEFRQLRSYPKYKKIWDISYENELGRLCQGVGTKEEDPTQNG